MTETEAALNPILAIEDRIDWHVDRAMTVTQTAEYSKARIRKAVARARNNR